MSPKIDATASATASSPAPEDSAAVGAVGAVAGKNTLLYVIGALAVAALLIGAFNLGRK